MPCICRNPANCLICGLSEPGVDVTILGARLELTLDLDETEECEATDYAVEPRQRLGKR